jgi:hypothetical protein
MTNQFVRNTEKYLGESCYVKTQGWQNFACRARGGNSQPLYFYSLYPTCPNYDRRSPNECVPALAVTKGLSFPWRGNVIATGEYGDLNMRDYRAAVDFLQAHPQNMALADPIRYHGRAIDGVKMNCDDAMIHHKVERLQPVKLTEYMIIENCPSPLRILPLLPLIARIAPPVGDRPRGPNPYCIIALLESQLFATKCPGMMKLAELKLRQQGGCKIGTLVVHRDDKKPLLPVHMEAFEWFVQEKARLVVDAEGKVWRDNIARRLKREDFDAFWPRFVKKLEARGEPVPPSPFEM